MLRVGRAQLSRLHDERDQAGGEGQQEERITEPAADSFAASCVGRKELPADRTVSAWLRTHPLPLA